METSRQLDPKVESVYRVRITGDRSIPAGKTGAGVRLGDGLDELVAKYGHRYRTGEPSGGSKSVLNVIFYFSDESELVAEFSDDGEITGLQLTASLE